mmetsp:Transcript_123450/g.348817  ORF Transcript_123450/g.348817 Transcript_123450/m.348817 type:complete len:261 (+) Transcript_123450:968-1750(+)
MTSNAVASVACPGPLKSSMRSRMLLWWPCADPLEGGHQAYLEPVEFQEAVFTSHKSKAAVSHEPRDFQEDALRSRCLKPAAQVPPSWSDASSPSALEPLEPHEAVLNCERFNTMGSSSATFVPGATAFAWSWPFELPTSTASKASAAVRRSPRKLSAFPRSWPSAALCPSAGAVAGPKPLCVDSPLVRMSLVAAGHLRRSAGASLSAPADSAPWPAPASAAASAAALRVASRSRRMATSRLRCRRVVPLGRCSPWDCPAA